MGTFTLEDCCVSLVARQRAMSETKEKIELSVDATWVKDRLAEKNIQLSSNQESYLQAYVEGIMEQKNIEICELLEDENELEQVVKALKNEVSERVLEIESLLE